MINTHWHGDHRFGNRVYKEAFPDVEIVAHPLTRELVITRELPSLEKNLTTECPATLTRIDATKIVPGHGPVQTDWSYVNRLIPLFETTWEQVRKAVASGADLEATRKAVNVDSHRDAFGGSTPEARRSFDALFLNPAIESAFKELRPDSTSRN